MFEGILNKIESRTSDKKDYQRNVGILCGLIGIFTNTLLAVLKLIVGFSINSISIMADAVNNFSDAGASIITIIAFFMANKPADDEHPFGHARAEYISAMILSMMVIFVGFQFFKISWDRIINPSQMVHSYTSLLFLILSIIIKVFQSKFYLSAGKKTNSKTLIAASLDSKSDVLITTVIVVSLFVSKFLTIQIDGYVGIVVSLLIIYSGWNITKDIIDSILGCAPDEEFKNEIIREIKNVDGIMGCHDLIVHNYGEGRMVVTAHAEVSDKLGLIEAHDIIDNAEKIVSDMLGINLLLHLDPIDFDSPKIKMIFDDVKNKLKDIDLTIDIHDFRFLNKCENKVAFDMAVPLSFDEDKIFMLRKYISDYINAKYNVEVENINVDRGNTIF